MTELQTTQQREAVLIIEDNLPFGELMADALCAEGYRCQIMTSGAAALSWLADHTAQLLLLDYQLPDMSGEVFAARLNEQGVVIPFVVVTGRDDSRLAVQMIKQGASDFVLKDTTLLDRLPLVVYRALAEAATRQRLQQAEQEIYQLANFDTLTGLPNRNLLRDRLQQAITQASRMQYQVGVLLLDLDRFKGVNESLGHLVGDKLLRLVAERLQVCVRESDTLARLGGDEFVCILSGVPDEDGISSAASKILTMIAEPFVIDGHELYLTASIGIAVYPTDGTDVSTLLKHADLAMYQAKENDRNTFRFFCSDLNIRVMERVTLEHALRRALEREEFLLYYQPQVDVVSNRLIGFEALLRWNHAKLGMIAPEKFVPLPEETGLICAIGEWVIGEASRQVRRWRERKLPAVRVAVNLSGRQFKAPLDQMVAAIMLENNLDAGWLELELTESILMRDAVENLDLLRKLTALGCSLSLDDFGTGYSSLAYLKHFPLGRLKIDRSFVRDILSNPDDRAIAKIIIDMAHTLKMEVTAEGVEDRDQLELLKSYGCREMQGYLFSRPVPAEQAELLLRNGITY